MVNGVHGEITPLVLKAAELDTKQEHVPATTLLHLEVDMLAFWSDVTAGFVKETYPAGLASDYCVHLGKTLNAQ